MCGTLVELEQAMSVYCAGFDAALVPPAELAQVVRSAGAIEKMAATISSLVAARMATGAGQPNNGGEGKSGKGHGAAKTSARQAAETLARATGTSMGQARRAIEAGQAMGSQPDVEAAARAGELSRDQAALISGAAKANPAATGRLLGLARTSSLSELAQEAERARAAAEDLEARRRRTHAERSLRQWTDAFGTWHLVAQGLPEDGARVMAAIGPLADEAFEAARKQGRHERPEAYAYDGLVALATAGGTQAGATEIMVRVDHSAMVRGYAIDGETCEVAGFGTVTPQVIFDMLDSGDPFLKAIVTKGKDVVGVAHLGRRPNAYQKSALDWLFPTCAAEGCGVRASFLQSDHRVDWAKTRVTIFDLLDRLCRHHHGLKTNHGWALVHGRGKRAFVPPDDPRHPRHGGPHSTNAPPP